MKKLYFKYGTMNSGKTFEILRTAHNYEENGYKALIVKPIIDKKENDKIISRVGLSKKVDYLLGENELLSKEVSLKDISAILVDEAQFLSEKQVDDLWKISKFNDINVFCYGLKSDFQTKSFIGSRRLFELADKLEEVTTLCKCGNKAMFNLRRKNNIAIFEGNQVSIDGIDATYEPVCGLCYLKEKDNFIKK